MYGAHPKRNSLLELREAEKCAREACKARDASAEQVEELRELLWEYAVTWSESPNGRRSSFMCRICDAENEEDSNVSHTAKCPLAV
jgi:hypothetical protein